MRAFQRLRIERTFVLSRSAPFGACVFLAFCVRAIVPKLPGSLTLERGCTVHSKLDGIHTRRDSTSLGAPGVLCGQEGASPVSGQGSLPEPRGSVHRGSGTATSSADWAAWPTAPGSPTGGCGSTATQWVGVPPAPPVGLCRSSVGPGGACVHFSQVAVTGATGEELKSQTP